nr:Hpt domain-containing protein [Desulfobacula sp.]
MIPETPENDVVNIEELKEIMDGDMELIRDCFTDFAQNFPQDFDEIKHAAMAKDGPKLNASAHKLKGTLRYLAAEKAADAAYRLELSGKSNELENLEGRLETLNHECGKVLEFIRTFKG